jgi:hypothetical protein
LRRFRWHLALAVALELMLRLLFRRIFFLVMVDEGTLLHQSSATAATSCHESNNNDLYSHDNVGISNKAVQFIHKLLESGRHVR